MVEIFATCLYPIRQTFDLGTILLMFLLSAVVIAGVVVVGLIGYTFVRDIKNKKLAPNEETMYIRRKK